jgi:predicted Zn-dependent peptidase
MPVEMLNVNGIKIANIKNQSGIAFFGIAVLAGSNYETPSIAGISHFAEHLYFKGTTSRNWKQINEEFAKLGVNNNAYTSNTEVLYHATCPIDNIEPTIALMLDMFFNSTIPKEELEKERNVIIEEKKMYDDDHGAAFFSAIGNNMLNWQVGHDTIGTLETINSISRDEVVQYLNDKINLDNFVFVCCGDINSTDLIRYIEKNIPSNHPYLFRKFKNNIYCDNIWSDIIRIPNKIKFIFERENITQSNAFLLANSLPSNDPMHYQEAILFKAIGGGMYSLLFAKIREELGLCYACGMTVSQVDYPKNNMSNLYGYVSPENVDKFMLESEKVLQSVMKDGLDKDIFECAKTDYLSSVLRNTETSAGKAMRLSSEILVFDNASIEDSLTKIRAVTREECNELAKKALNNQYNWTVMNPKNK